MIKRYHGFSPESKLYNVIVIFSKQVSSPFHTGELKVSLFQSRFRVYERQQRLITCQVLLLCFVFMIFDKRVKIYTESWIYNLEMFHSLSTVRNRTFESSKYQLTQKAFRCQSNLFVVFVTQTPRALVLLSRQVRMSLRMRPSSFSPWGPITHHIAIPSSFHSFSFLGMQTLIPACTSPFTWRHGTTRDH